MCYLIIKRFPYGSWSHLSMYFSYLHMDKGEDESDRAYMLKVAFSSFLSLVNQLAVLMTEC